MVGSPVRAFSDFSERILYTIRFNYSCRWLALPCQFSAWQKVGVVK